MKIMKKFIAGILCVVMLCALSVTAFASDEGTAKEEIIYVIADSCGTVSSINAVEIFASGDNIAYGNFSDIKSLNTTDKINKSNASYSFSTEASRAYVQGTMENVQIPWIISVRYELDGKYYSAKEIAGKSGQVKIYFEITENKECAGEFYNSYALQASFTLDTGKWENITAEGATVVNAGNEKQITYTILPGRGISAVITADVTAFEMEAVTVNGIKLALNIEIDDSELMEKVTELTDAIEKLNGGTDTLYNGTKELKNGISKLYSGTETLSKGASDLNDGIEALDSGITKINSGLNELNEKNSDLTDGSDKILSALTEVQTKLSVVSNSSEAITKLVQGSAGIKSGITELYNSASELQSHVGFCSYKAVMNKNGLDIDELRQSNAETISALTTQITGLKQNIQVLKTAGQDTSELEATVAQLSDTVKLLSGNNAAIEGTEVYLNSVESNITKLVNGIGELKNQYNDFDNGIISLANKMENMLLNLSDLRNGIDTLVTQYTLFHSGLNNYTGGVADIVAGYSQIVSGSKALLQGSSSLASGADELYTQTYGLVQGMNQLYDGTDEVTKGISELYSQTDNIDSMISDKIDSMLKSITGENSETISFVDERNTSVSDVQFIIKLSAVELPEENIKAEDNSKPLTFWQKLLRLFGLY